MKELSPLFMMTQSDQAIENILPEEGRDFSYDTSIQMSTSAKTQAVAPTGKHTQGGRDWVQTDDSYRYEA